MWKHPEPDYRNIFKAGENNKFVKYTQVNDFIQYFWQRLQLHY